MTLGRAIRLKHKQEHKQSLLFPMNKSCSKTQAFPDSDKDKENTFMTPSQGVIFNF